MKNLKSKESKVGTLSTCKEIFLQCNYILTTEQGHRVIKCLKCGDVKPI